MSLFRALALCSAVALIGVSPDAHGLNVSFGVENAVLIKEEPEACSACLFSNCVFVTDLTPNIKGFSGLNFPIGIRINVALHGKGVKAVGMNNERRAWGWRLIEYGGISHYPTFRPATHVIGWCLPAVFQINIYNASNWRGFKVIDHLRPDVSPQLALSGIRHSRGGKLGSLGGSGGSVGCLLRDKKGFPHVSGLFTGEFLQAGSGAPEGGRESGNGDGRQDNKQRLMRNNESLNGAETLDQDQKYRAIEVLLILVGFLACMYIFVGKVKREISQIRAVNNNENQDSPPKD
jgi:hypothetical protein